VVYYIKKTFQVKVYDVLITRIDVVECLMYRLMGILSRSKSIAIC